MLLPAPVPARGAGQGPAFLPTALGAFRAWYANCRRFRASAPSSALREGRDFTVFEYSVEGVEFRCRLIAEVGFGELARSYRGTPA